MHTSLNQDQRQKDVVNNRCFQLMQLFWLEIERCIFRYIEVMLCNKEVEDRVPEKLQSFVIVQAHVNMCLMILHRVEVLFERLVGHGLNQEARVVELVANDILQILEIVTILRDY